MVTFHARHLLLLLLLLLLVVVVVVVVVLLKFYIAHMTNGKINRQIDLLSTEQYILYTDVQCTVYTDFPYREARHFKIKSVLI